MPIHGYPGNIITANPPTPSVSSASGVWTTEQQLQNMTAGNWPMAATQISRSLRFNSADSAYLNRTPASASNRKTWTWSGWVKISSLPVNNALFAAYKGSGSVDNEFFALYFSSGTLRAGGYSTTYLESSAVYRDFSAWYHVVCTIDTTSATSNNRVRLYINGFEITAFQTRNNPNQNTDLGVNQNTLHQIGQNGGFGNYFNGYMTEVHFIDGQALTPASFGQTNSATGVWEPRQYTGPYGTNGFYLNFSDNSGTTSTTLGKDSSGNGNNWTPNNFSVTAGAGNDSLVDSPTAYGTDTGAGGEVRGNYATWNPVAITGTGTATLSITNGNLETTNLQGSWRTSKSTIGMSSGKWYCETTVTSISGTLYCRVGIATTAAATDSYLGSDAYGWAYINTGNKSTNLSNDAYGASWTTNDVVGIAFDADAGTLTFYKNGVSQGTAYSSLTSGPYFFAIAIFDPSVVYANFGQRPFAYTAPSGFKALCTTNLTTPTIGATATTRADDYFNAVIWSGDNTSSRSITGVGFQPDWVWIKNRTSTTPNLLWDAVRTATYYLMSNSTSAESNNSTATSGYMSAFASDGFTLTRGTSNGSNVNENSNNYVAWNWNAGGSNATNTSGTITSTVRANTTAGFSIVTYTGNGSSSATVGHGLTSPSMVIVKRLSSATTGNTDNWVVKHTSLAGTQQLYLNQGIEAFNAGSVANGGISINTSTIGFLSGTTGVDQVNENTKNYVAYCFAAIAGYSAFGSYTGNGSTDGPMVYTGFRPAYVLIKLTTNAAIDWVVFDNKRNTYNATDARLFPSLSNAEAAGAPIDLLSNGFKMRENNSYNNGSGWTYVYMAFAEFPFKYTLAR